MELVLALPILAIVLAGLLEFTWLFFARGEVVEAARVACRKATLPGDSIDRCKWMRCWARNRGTSLRWL
jgi:Flp pilus assembly protein TadG